MPLATVGTILALPPVFGHDPASEDHSGFKAPPDAVPSNACNVTCVFLSLSGRPTAQMIAVFAATPLEEIEVKNPGSCPDVTAALASIASAGEVAVSTFHCIISLPPLLTTRPTPSDPLK